MESFIRHKLDQANAMTDDAVDQLVAVTKEAVAAGHDDEIQLALFYKLADAIIGGSMEPAAAAGIIAHLLVRVAKMELGVTSPVLPEPDR